MNWKETVKLCGEEHCQPYCHETQAEISYKAGMWKVVESIGDCFGELARIADILKDDNMSNALAIDALFNINKSWQAKLKEWGITDVI